MMKTEANVEIKRHNGVLSSISVIMPKWLKVEDDETISIEIPLFGMKTVAKEYEDVPVAIKEAITCFCIASEKFGNGVESELSTLGWNLVNQKNNHSLLEFRVQSEDYVLDQIMQTGEQYAETNLLIENEIVA